MHIARVGERLPRLQIQFRISRSFRPRNLANLRSKIRFWIRRKEHTLNRDVTNQVNNHLGCLPHSLSKRQSLSTTVLFRTTLTRTIKLKLLTKWLLGSNISQFFLYPLDHCRSFLLSFFFFFFARCEAVNV